MAAIDFNNLDPQVVQLAKAIRTTESNGNFKAVGDNGHSIGAYQWNDPNGNGMAHFQDEAKSFGLDPNDFSPVNQDKVAYAKMKTLKDQGYHAGEIAAMWNGAHTINGRPVANNQDYITKVQGNLAKVQASAPATHPVSNYNPAPFTSPAGTPGAVDLSTDPKAALIKPNSFKDAAGKLGGSVGKIAADVTGTQGVGESITSGIIPHLKEFKDAQASQEKAAQGPVKILQAIRKNKQEGKDTSRLEAYYQQLTGNPPPDLMDQVDPQAKKSTLKALGEVGLMGGSMLAAGSFEPASMDAGALSETGNLADTAIQSGQLSKESATLPKLFKAGLSKIVPKSTAGKIIGGVLLDAIGNKVLSPNVKNTITKNVPLLKYLIGEL